VSTLHGPGEDGFEGPDRPSSSSTTALLLPFDFLGPSISTSADVMGASSQSHDLKVAALYLPDRLWFLRSY
jgi:hypothetical protein